jgi:AcrR family transcriptional regulator
MKTINEQKHQARNPVQKRGMETKKKIIDAAEALFGEKGYHKTNASRAGVATGSFYSYFNNKKEALIEIIMAFYSSTTEKVLNSYDVKVQDNVTGNYLEGKKLIHNMIKALYDAHTISPSLHREFIAMVMLDHDIEAISREEDQKVIAAIKFLFDSLNIHIRIKDTEAAAMLLHRVSEEIVHYIRIMGSDMEDNRLLAELEDMICRYVLVEG